MNAASQIAPEWLVLGMIVVVLLVCYGWVFPKFCGSDLRKIVINDLIAVLVVMSVSASQFAGSGQSFSLLLFDVNWFWFTLISYFVLELPFMIRYFNKHDLWSKLDD